MIWHLYDYYLTPGGAFFGTMKACAPIHIMYTYNDSSVWLVNSNYVATPPLIASAAVYDTNSALVWKRTMTVSSLSGDGVAELFFVPQLTNVTTTYLLRLGLSSVAGAPVDTNVYWLSTQPDVLDWSKSSFYRTACSAYMNLQGLASMPLVTLNQTASISASSAQVSITNPTSVIALAVRARLVDAVSGVDVAPIFWDDNFVSIWPGEKVQLVATYNASQAPTLVIEGFNLQ